MKKRIGAGMTAAVLALLIAAPAAGQYRAQGDFRIGVTGGATHSTLKGEYIVSGDWRTGFVAGLYADYMYTGAIAIRIEANYVQKGAENVVTTVGDSLEVKLVYFEIPVLFNFVISVGNRIGVELYTGATLGFNSSCEFTEAGGQSQDCGPGTPIPTAKSNEWSWPLGAALGVKVMDRLNVLADVRYSQTWSNTFETVDAKTRMWEAMLRAEFGL
jgi:hypothetical protein